MIVLTNDDGNEARLHWKTWARVIDDAYAMGWRGMSVFTFEAGWKILCGAVWGYQPEGCVTEIPPVDGAEFADALEAVVRFGSLQSLAPSGVLEVASLCRRGAVRVRIEAEEFDWIKNGEAERPGALGAYDYDRLHRCPFCHQLTIDDCEHYVATFRIGDWVPGTKPLFYWNGVQFDRAKFEAAADGNGHIACLEKPGTWSHPRARAYYAANRELVQELREAFQRPQIEAGCCDGCGLIPAVVNERGQLVCAFCEAPAEEVDESEI